MAGTAKGRPHTGSAGESWSPVLTTQAGLVPGPALASAQPLPADPDYASLFCEVTFL